MQIRNNIIVNCQLSIINYQLSIKNHLYRPNLLIVLCDNDFGNAVGEYVVNFFRPFHKDVGTAFKVFLEAHVIYFAKVVDAVEVEMENLSVFL